MPGNDVPESPFRPADDEARALARTLLAQAAFAALGVLEPETGAPMVTRIALATVPDGAPLTLISDLALHAGALRADPRCSLLVGEPGRKGDPLTHPRLTLRCRAGFAQHDDPGHAALRRHYLAQRPKAALYADFADFHFVTMRIEAGYLNAGFGRAYRLAPADILPG
ncbi:pyridoxamine 5-phosphate oxidase [Maritimibacter sp. 55A14]|uniref:HugZ family pyridoxamine 5'-phosphate oxidase n=1 Tax=Maritimibacter sp. 55A14 TaxID=2174844 RepID=UPI000D620074|nr:pyridoxamine 5'-phosphate oxidase family protein [Maritimibacter sp. 55A14]PWE29291.1 pyridoxamine 5-phosphate oxidase [Maritimibacter sp. 55A14]